MSNIPNFAPTVISASGAVTPVNKGLFHITKSSAAALLTLVAPDTDGQQMVFIDESGKAHTITIAAVGSPPTAGLNGGAVTTLTFNATKGSSVELYSRNGSWFTGPLNGVALS